MDPLTLIVTAAVLGAAAGLESTAEQAIKDAYTGLKTLIQHKYRNIDVSLLESDPASDARKEVIKEELEKTTAAEDEELLRAARSVLQSVEQYAPGIAAEVNIRLEDVKAAANVKIVDLIASGTGARVEVEAKKVEANGDIVIKGIEARGSEEPDPK